jgi:hypothetical protein
MTTTYVGCQELETARLIYPLLADAVPVLQHERDLDHPHRPGCHQRVPEDGVHHVAERQMLRMRAHRPAGHDDHEGRDQVPLRPAISLSAEPDAQEAGTPPHDAHGRMLQVVADPGPSPAVLREGVDAAPGRDDQRVEELLAVARSSQPALADGEHDDEQDPVGDERAPHDEMRQTLPQVVLPAEAQRGYPAEEHLHPARHRQHLAHHPVCEDEPLPDASLESLFEVQFQVYSEQDLRGQHEAERIRKGRVDVPGELPPAMGVPEEVAGDREDRADDLDGDMPGGPHYLFGGGDVSVRARVAYGATAYPEDHAGREHYAPCDGLYEDVYPERGILTAPSANVRRGGWVGGSTIGSDEMASPSGIFSS